jgi:hypothetical protein
MRAAAQLEQLAPERAPRIAGSPRFAGCRRGERAAGRRRSMTTGRFGAGAGDGEAARSSNDIRSDCCVLHPLGRARRGSTPARGLSRRTGTPPGPSRAASCSPGLMDRRQLLPELAVATPDCPLLPSVAARRRRGGPLSSTWPLMRLIRWRCRQPRAVARTRRALEALPESHALRSSRQVRGPVAEGDRRCPGTPRARPRAGWRAMWRLVAAQDGPLTTLREWSDERRDQKVRWRHRRRAARRELDWPERATARRAEIEPFERV